MASSAAAALTRTHFHLLISDQQCLFLFFCPPQLSNDKRVAAEMMKPKPKPQKKKKKKDPNEPQKPVSAYALFFRDTQAAIKGQNPNATFGDVSKIVASMWDSLGEEQKQVCNIYVGIFCTISMHQKLQLCSTTCCAPDVHLWFPMVQSPGRTGSANSNVCVLCQRTLQEKYVI